MRLNAGVAAAIAVALLACGPAPGAGAGPVEVSVAWSRPTPPGAMGAAYLVITNHGPREDWLMAASTPAAGDVEIDETRVVGNIARMRAIDSLRIPAGGSVTLQPGGFHIMLMDLPQPLKAGMRYPLALRFRDAGTITVQVEVRESP